MKTPLLPSWRWSCCVIQSEFQDHRTHIPYNLIFGILSIKASCSMTVIHIYRPTKPSSSCLSEPSEPPHNSLIVYCCSATLASILIQPPVSLHLNSSLYSTISTSPSTSLSHAFRTHVKGHSHDLVCSVNLTLLNIHSSRNTKSVDPLQLSDLLSNALPPESALNSTDDLT